MKTNIQFGKKTVERLREMHMGNYLPKWGKEKLVKGMCQGLDDTECLGKKLVKTQEGGTCFAHATLQTIGAARYGYDAKEGAQFFEEYDDRLKKVVKKMGSDGGHAQMVVNMFQETQREKKLRKQDFEEAETKIDSFAGLELKQLKSPFPQIRKIKERVKANSRQYRVIEKNVNDRGDLRKALDGGQAVYMQWWLSPGDGRQMSRRSEAFPKKVLLRTDVECHGQDADEPGFPGGLYLPPGDCTARSLAKTKTPLGEFGGDKEKSGHAMAVVGYAENEADPSGDDFYVIVRDSNGPHVRDNGHYRIHADVLHHQHATFRTVTHATTA